VYTRSAAFYDDMYHFKDYAAASDKLKAIIDEHRPGAVTLLDVACSTGQHLEHVQRHFQVQGLDINPDLVELARERCPGVPIHVADMMSFDLPDRFDVVTCLFSSIAYARTVENLRRAVATMAAHLTPDGLLVIEPWVAPEQYWENNVVMNVGARDGRKWSWMYVGVREGTLVTGPHPLPGGLSGGRRVVRGAAPDGPIHPPRLPDGTRPGRDGPRPVRPRRALRARSLPGPATVTRGRRPAVGG